jgi:hypothetical protein
VVGRASDDMLAPANHDAPAPALPLHDEGGAPGADFLDELLAPQRRALRKRRAPGASEPAALSDGAGSLAPGQEAGQIAASAHDGDDDVLREELLAICDGDPEEASAFQGLLGVDSFADDEVDGLDAAEADLGAPDEGIRSFDPAGPADEEEPLLVCLSANSDSGPEDLSMFMGRMQMGHSSGLSFPRDVFCTATNVFLGRIHTMWGRTYKATCKRHSNCSLMLETKWFAGSGDRALHLVLYRWLCLGKYATAAEHNKASGRASSQVRPCSSSNAAPSGVH